MSSDTKVFLRMKLLVVSPSRLSGGAEYYNLLIATGVMKQGWSVWSAFPKTPQNFSLIDDFKRVGVQYHQLEIGEYNESGEETLFCHGLQSLRTLYALQKIRPDVVLVSLSWPLRGFGTLLACALLNIPTLVVFQLAPHVIPLRKRLHLYTWARQRDQQWIAVSDQNRKALSQTFRVSLDQIHLIYNSIQLERYAPKDPQEVTACRTKIRQELHLSHNARILLTVGRLHAQKGYHDIIPVVPHVIKEFDNAYFVWAGEGGLREELEERIQTYELQGKILLLGHRTDIPDLLLAADLFVFPTHFEGFPFSLLEAMAAGLPVVSSDASSIPEILTHHEHGLLYRTSDSCDLLETLRWALRHPDGMQQMALHALKHVQTFRKDTMLRKTLSELRKLYNNK